MIEVKAKTENELTHTEVNIKADDVDYMAEVIAIIESLMRGLREANVLLHATVFKVILEHPHILLGVKEDSEFREGVN